jgi:D-inositol-3-phosphate glycosyltransferase
MDQDPVRRLLSALSSTSVDGPPSRRYAHIEHMVGELLGAKARDARDSLRGPDFVIARPPDAPLAIELKVFSGSYLGKNVDNRISDLLASAVEIRRAYSHEIALSAILLFATPHPPSRFISRFRGVLRRADGVGFDSVLIGWPDDDLRWVYLETKAASSSPDEQDARPGSAREAFALLKQQPSSPSRASVVTPPRARRMLLVADEWRSGHGGISTVNRELATALAAAGVEAAVLVPRASETDIRAASDLNVALVTPARPPGLNDREALLLRPVFADSDWRPDVIVGHGRLLGPYAAAQQQQFFPDARRVHFVHTDAEQLEAAKEVPGGRSNMVSAEERRTLERDLARSADLVVGVGPLLTETISDELIGPGTPPSVICLVPGLRESFDTSVSPPPVKNRVLLVGRADDFQSKGIDIAAEAMLRVVDRWGRTAPHPPSLVIRGVPDDAAGEVKERLENIFEGRVAFALRPYSDSEEAVVSDLAQARVLLMPSRHEGFGLSAYEAIASAVPILISAESGLAQFLREAGIDTSPSSIVPIRNSTSRLASDRWADAIQAVLENPAVARAQGVQLRNAVATFAGWSDAVDRLLHAIDSIA